MPAVSVVRYKWYLKDRRCPAIFHFTKYKLFSDENAKLFKNFPSKVFLLQQRFNRFETVARKRILTILVKEGENVVMYIMLCCIIASQRLSSIWSSHYSVSVQTTFKASAFVLTIHHPESKRSFSALWRHGRLAIVLWDIWFSLLVYLGISRSFAPNQLNFVDFF